MCSGLPLAELRLQQRCSSPPLARALRTVGTPVECPTGDAGCEAERPSHSKRLTRSVLAELDTIHTRLYGAGDCAFA
jgi:hypothetical protein